MIRGNMAAGPQILATLPVFNTLKPQSNGPLYSNMVTGTLAVDGWAVTLVHQKEEEFWRTKVDSKRSCPRALWRSVDALMGRGRAPVSGDIDAKTLHKYFEDKVDGVRLATADAQPPTYVSRSRNQ